MQAVHRDTKQVAPALLTLNEILWLQGRKGITNKHTERSMKSKIKRKIQTFIELELPLLSSNGYLRLGDLAGGCGDPANECGASNQVRYLEPSPSLRSGSGGVVRLSISPSQGGDPGFKSRPEHSFTYSTTTGFGSPNRVTLTRLGQFSYF